MINELNITNEELVENTAEAFAGESKGVIDENKIVPIVNKGNSAEAGIMGTTADPTPQTIIPEAQAAVQTISQTAQAIASEAQTASYDNIAAQSDTEAGNTSAPDTPTTANTSTASDTAAPPEPERKHRRKASSYTQEFDDGLSLDEEDPPRKRFFHFRSNDEEESRDKLILSRIKDEDLMEYLALEQRRLEFLQHAREAKEKRLLIAFQLLISLAAIVAITYLLQDNPTILISILYIVGIVAALNVWKNPHDKGRRR